MMQTITMTKPDDWHVHLRDGKRLATTVPATAKSFARAMIMPNLDIPITTVALAKAYRQRILAHVPRSLHFTPLMTLYLTDETTPEMIIAAKQAGFVHACKLYPRGATTQSSFGVTDLTKIYPTLEALAEQGIVLAIHGEVVDPDTDIFDREKVFIETKLIPLLDVIPNLRVVLEHISTIEAVNFVEQASDNVAATMTIHHLLLNRNDLLVFGIKPNYYCLPILKSKQHQRRLIEAALSGNKKFFLGTDTAPHARKDKENICGCAGIYSAPAALESYAEFFANHGKLDKLEAFASHYGADFYRLPYNQEKITLYKQLWLMEKTLAFGDDEIVPFRAEESIVWKVGEDE